MSQGSRRVTPLALHPAAVASVPYGIVLVRAAAAVVVVVVVVVRGGKHAFGAHTFSTYYAHN